jgi:four helix bundle protein
MKSEQLRDRTKAFAVSVIRLVQSLAKSKEADTIANQLLRCGTGVGATYRRVRYSRSKPDLVARIARVIRNVDESAYWLELLNESAGIKGEGTGRPDTRSTSPAFNIGDCAGLGQETEIIRGRADLQS